MTRTPLAGLIGAFVFTTAASLILVRRFYNTMVNLSLVVPLSLWIVAAACAYFAYMVKKRREEGKVGLDRSQLNPMMAANLMIFGKACSWAGALCGGLYAGVLVYVVPQLSVLAAAGEDFPSVLSGALGGVALAAAGVWLERSCEVSPPSAGEGVS
ncbi:DUF3180 domain-containing protein [Corynebacterium sp. CNCTC7651]|uniref:DUF3180 domain-containing protein n=1 Tax=Corynebacterium sp. CNCTC7651 TaxID=2815361 RepID=UPI001F3E3735|nr:DUF3180 domain-containing protein [Corynebacterium sp. CNCTC7651]UIZ91894.1 DUF3180 domain-containing protein [Corynebacterium sp. CNCTC7651]